MKKSQDILGLPIISICDGLEVGKVKSIIINPDKGAIDYIVIDSGIQIISTRVIPSGNVLGIGEYALTIESEGAISDISGIPAAIQLLQKDIGVKGTRVLTKKGRLIGEIGDIYVDEDDNCKITGLEFIKEQTQQQVRIIPRDTVITFGGKLTVVTEDIESRLLDTPSQLDTGISTPGFESNNADAIDDLDRLAFADTVSAPSSETADDAEESQKAPEQDDNEGDNASILFEQRQRQYLKGRFATKSISDNEGNIIIGEGMQIDDAVIDEAKTKGKLIELVMNNRA